MEEQQLDTTVRGHWFVPSDPARRVAGTLRIRAGEAARLELFDALFAEEPENRSYVILGDIQNTPRGWTSSRVTIEEGYWAGRTTRMDGATTHEAWDGVGLLLGSWHSRPTETKFKRFSVETDRLREWAHTRSRGVPRPARADDDFGVSLHVPTPVQWAIEGGVVELRWYPVSTWNDHFVSVETTPVMEFELDSPITTDEAWRMIVTPILQLMVLITGKGDRIRRLRVFGGAELLPESVHPAPGLERATEWVPMSWTKPLPGVKTIWLDHVLSRHEAAERRSFMQRWFAMADTHRFAFLQYFAAALGDTSDLEDGFTRVLRAVEIWHRKEHGGLQSDPATFRAELRAAKKAMGKESWAILAPMARRANDLPLRARLDETIEGSGRAARLILEEFPEITALMVRTRNRLVHEGEKGDDLDYHDVWIAQRVLEMALRSSLLQRLGLEDPDLSERLQESREWEWLRGEVSRLASRRDNSSHVGVEAAEP